MSTRSLHRPAGLAAAASALVLSACGAAVAGPGEDAQRVDGGTIVYAHQQEPACVFGGWIEQAYLSYQVIDNLTSLDEDGETVPWLATAWQESDDRLSWTLDLRDDVQFTDGSDLDAEAVGYNFDYWLAGGNSTAQVWLETYYDGFEALDEHTIRIDLKRPYTNFAQNLSQGYFGIQSQEALETRSEEENCSAPIGSGAFTVQEWNRGENIVLARNEDYNSWPANAQHEGPAYVEKVDWRFVADPTTRTSALRSEEVQAIYDVPAVEWEGLDEAGYELQRYITAGRPQQLTFNTAQGPFVDEEVRKAFAYSLDRESLVETIGHGVIPFEGNGGVSQSTPGYSEYAAGLYTQDLARSAELLDAAGWDETAEDGVRTKDGERLSVTLPYGAGSIINNDGASILQGVAEQAAAVGFEVELVPVNPTAFFGGEYSAPDEKDLTAGYWTAINAGILYINWREHTEDFPNHNNGAFLDDPELAGIITAANGEADPARQEELYIEAQDYIADHALAIGVYDRLSTLASSPYLRGLWQEHAQGGPVFHDAHLVE